MQYDMILNKLNKLCICMAEKLPIKIDFADYPYGEIYTEAIIKKIIIHKMPTAIHNPYQVDIEIEVFAMENCSYTLPFYAISIIEND